MTETISASEIDQAAAAISSKGQYFVGKQIGKKVTRAIAVIIAVKITKKVLRSPQVTQSIRKKIVNMRKSMKQVKGGLVTGLMALLNVNGYLGLAAEESRRIQTRCPTLWKYLRHDLGGFDMMLFLIRGFMDEYLDRLAVLENNPQVFVKLMAALVKEGKTKEIFFPR